jgi:hypothetical protein
VGRFGIVTGSSWRRGVHHRRHHGLETDGFQQTLRASKRCTLRRRQPPRCVNVIRCFCFRRCCFKRYCLRRRAVEKKPRTIEFRSELPKSNVGKILRRELRDIA